LFTALTDWVEKNEPPENSCCIRRWFDPQTALRVSNELRYLSGDRALAASYACKN